MWVLLSTRLRTWLLLAIAVPVARSIIHRAAQRAAAKDPGSGTSKMLTRADSTLSRWVARRRERR